MRSQKFGETEKLRRCIEKGPQRLLNACDLEMQPGDAYALMELSIVHDSSICATQQSLDKVLPLFAAGALRKPTSK